MGSQSSWRSKVTTRKAATSAAVGLAILAGCATGASLSAGNPLPGIALSANGPSVLLSWDPEGPLGRQLGPRTPVQIVAAYPSERGQISGEPVASAVVDGQFPGLKFDLATRVQQVPTGPVCLRLATRGRAIPVRIPDAGKTSDGFLYSEWEAQAGQEAKRHGLSQRMRIVDTNLARVSAPSGDFDSWRQSRGLSNAAQCETLTADISQERPRTALTGAAKEAAARSHCVALFNDFPNDPAGFEGRSGLTGSQLASEIKQTLPRSHALTGAADNLIADIRRYGAGQVYLSTTGFAVDSATTNSLRIANGRVNEVTATSLLESYNACISEAEGRFELSYRSWRETSSSTVQGGRNEPLRQECRARFRAEDQRLTQLGQVRDEQARLQVELQALSNEKPPPLPAQKTLIPYACETQLRPT